MIIAYNNSLKSMPFMYRDRLYMMLSNTARYKSTKKVDAHLDLVLMNVPDDDSNRYGGFDLLLEHFEPAIASGLLRR